ncbi:MAG: prolyl oligopeptidase family serine peptidase [Micrococcales bacterium]|nr:prolyl oligopeptidase family serine peptidase [Micrococcales bacterium]
MTPRPPLLERGVVFAHAHVRGGGEMGRDWWEQGRLLGKRTTFDDFRGRRGCTGARRCARPGGRAPDRQPGLSARGC